MRRRLAGSAPALSHWFGLMPWDLERLTGAELGAYEQALAQIEKQQRRRG